MGGREVKLYYYAMKESKWGRGGGGRSKTILKKKLKEIKDQNKRVHKKLEGGCLWFNGKLSHRGGTGSH